ncbi:hypothetical protein [Caulobacter sp. DWR3-1-2]|uniref:hypothetical protein n=1 Tax=Caulobacter sp. DWR3-1-2 TaxID=2804647 RepID=UPI003CE7CFC1
MRIKAGFQITYDCPAPTPMLLMLNVHPDRQGHWKRPTPSVSTGTSDSPAMSTHLEISAAGSCCRKAVR